MLTCPWVLFGTAFVFAIYKNITGIDTHTVHEAKVIETKVIDTVKSICDPNTKELQLNLIRFCGYFCLIDINPKKKSSL